MEGPGVTNYATDKPTFARTPATTEWDDALLQRNIVTATQVMLAKGASVPEAERLVALREQKVEYVERKDSSSRSSPSDDDDDDSLEDDDVLLRYRKERTAQLQQPSSLQYIQKSDWHRCVNEASHHQWVVVCLTSSDTERTGCMEEAVKELSTTATNLRFVLIPYQQAIDEQWPLHNLPCLFLYRHGGMRKQLVRLGHHHTVESLQELLRSHIEELEEYK